MKHILTAGLTALLIAAGGSAGASTEAQGPTPIHTYKNGSMKLEKADREVKKRKVVYAERIVEGNRLYVELNTGATFDLTHCLVEDGRNCHWDAKVVYNKVGKSFIDIKGKVIYLPKRYQHL